MSKVSPHVTLVLTEDATLKGSFSKVAMICICILQRLTEGRGGLLYDKERHFCAVLSDRHRGAHVRGVLH